MKYLKIVFLNLTIILVSYAVALFGRFFDGLIGLDTYQSDFYFFLGHAILLLGLYFRVGASFEFYESKINILTLRAQDKLITNGVYRFSRNPLYIGITLILLSAVVTMGSYFGLFEVFVSWLVWNYWVRHKEEVYMKEAFGKQYDKYRAEVPRWF